MMGSPAIDLANYYKSYAIFRRLPELRKQIIDLEIGLKELKTNKS